MLSYRGSRGIGVVDIMLGLFIGTLVSLAAYATLIVFRSFERTGVSANSALENGISAVYAIEHDVKMSGLGFIANNLITCNTLNASFNGNLIANNAFISPVIVTSGGLLPDSISIIYGNTINGGTPATTISSVSVPASTTVSTWSTYGMQAGDAALFAQSTGGLPCTLVTITSVTNNGVNATIGFNPGNVPVVTYPANSQITDIGGLTWETWSIVNNQLQVANNLTGVAGTTIADNIVSMKAQYGVTNGVSEAIAQWVDPTGVWASNALTPAQSAQIRAIRLSILARSAQQELPSNGAAACNTTTVQPVPWVGGTQFNLTANANWQCFRYQVYETIIPLKNVLLGGVL